MISRVAEHCFWMSRYLERADNTARVLDVNQTLLLDFEVPLEQRWRPVLIISGVYDMPGEPEPEAVQNFMTWEEKNLSSIASSLNFARENARIIREVISAEMWERLNFYHLWLHGPGARNLYHSNRSEFYNQIRRINQLIHGIADGTMAHGEAWEFCQLGRYLERACQTARILDVKYHMILPTATQSGVVSQEPQSQPENAPAAELPDAPASRESLDQSALTENAHWMAILTSCSGYEPFNKKVHSPLNLGSAVVGVLIIYPLFPRSVWYCLHACQQAAHAISGRPIVPGNSQEAQDQASRASLTGSTSNLVERELADLIGYLGELRIAGVLRKGLHTTLTQVVDRTHLIGEYADSTYFNLALAPLRPARAPPLVPRSGALAGVAALGVRVPGVGDSTGTPYEARNACDTPLGNSGMQGSTLSQSQGG